MKRIMIPVPNFKEQGKITLFLDEKCAHIDSIIKKTKASIEEYKKLKQNIITQTVMPRIIENANESGWEYIKLKYFITMPVVDGPHESPELYSEGIPYISATAIENGKINFSLMRGFISEEYCMECEKRYKPQRGDILVIKLGASTGQVALIDTDERFNIWVPLAAVRCCSSVVPKFIYYAFQADYLIRQMELSWTFGTQQTLGVKMIEKLGFWLPNYNEQINAASYLDKKCTAIDTLISKKEQCLTELENYKKSLIYEYVTGKKEVP
jgi:type I restriction enzyme S subunit